MAKALNTGKSFSFASIRRNGFKSGGTLVALSFFAFLIAACEPQQTGTTGTGTGTTTTTEQPTAQDPAATTDPTAQQVTDDPEQFIGQTVSVQGSVDEVLAGNIFRMQEADGGIFGGNSILVISEGAEAVAPAEDQNVMVMGEVQRLTAAQLEQTYNITLTDEVRNEFSDEGEPVILAQSIQEQATQPAQ